MSVLIVGISLTKLLWFIKKRSETCTTCPCIPTLSKQGQVFLNLLGVRTRNLVEDPHHSRMRDKETILVLTFLAKVTLYLVETKLAEIIL